LPDMQRRARNRGRWLTRRVVDLLERRAVA
jgi:hypothetical protein